jgi:hypothetical protein
MVVYKTYRDEKLFRIQIVFEDPGKLGKILVLSNIDLPKEIADMHCTDARKQGDGFMLEFHLR